MKTAKKYFVIAFLIVLIDQIIKIVVKTQMHLGQEFSVIGNVFKIHFVENKGAAFGMTITDLVNNLGLNMTPETGKIILSIFSLFAASFIAYGIYRTAQNYNTSLPLWLAIVFGGAMGNIIDRVFYGLWFADINVYPGSLMHGRVVDMFFFDIWHGTLPSNIPLIGDTYVSLFPVFNIADIAISIGIVAILFFQKRLFQYNQPQKEETPVFTPEVNSQPL